MNQNFKKFYYILKISYDGSSYLGWAKQKNVRNTIQEQIEKMLKEIFLQDINLISASRTDKGVHAYSQIAMFSLDLKLKILAKTMKTICNENLPNDILIKNVKVLANNNNFHPRYNAKFKTYLYKIKFNSNSPFGNKYYWYLNKKILWNLNDLEKCFKLFEGKHNFLSYFNKYRKQTTTNFDRTIFEIKYTLNSKYLYIYISGDGFGRNMVRLIIGNIVDYLLDRVEFNFLVETLKKPSKNYLISLAPPQGLYLYKIKY